MGKVYAVSDLHGNYELWQKIKDYLQPDDMLYILGDCADRGKHGWAIIKEAFEDDRIDYMRGNHDQFILDSWKDNYKIRSVWYYNGGLDTYNAMLADPNAEKTLQKLQETSLYCIYCAKNGNLIHLSHAGFSLVEDMPEEEQLLWDREHISDAVKFDENTYIVHGHTSVRWLCHYGALDIEANPSQTIGKYCGGHKICIDGGSAFSNKCALLDLDTLKEVVFEV